ncbi:CRISPR-associated protein Cas4 [Deferribacterales bacterium Es71-Z0220]|jgi:CRISPR-associated exonuclease Cas4|uniref:CRISPR-associated protein Cas4 n=1 Tax=Deferrivibrio essentukiensis TaxID=2880922 RepID=UPI001F61F654|nr:CRISPR-associated protein Cas4 [Deferrivibrio essentukiensis]MCB4205475.1 CRISPR-associated protein Cas4 [Deferrivibrio essentukiensis]
MKTFAPSIFNAYTICKRQAWLMMRNLTADQDNAFLEIGRLIDETSFERQKKKIFLADLEAMLDMVSKKDGIYYIAEIKKSSKTMNSGIFQLKYYLYLLKTNKGLKARGIIKIPKEKISKEIILTEEDEEKITTILSEMNETLFGDKPPQILLNSKICKVCAHFEFCYG